jgi:hypothetical protein
MEEKLRVDREVLRACSVPSVLPAWSGNTRQVAFLFMTEDGLDFEVSGLGDPFSVIPPASALPVYQCTKFYRPRLVKLCEGLGAKSFASAMASETCDL